MKINYNKENKKYQERIKEYREVTAKVIAKEKNEQTQRKQNKRLPSETEYEVMFKDIKEDNLHWSEDSLELPNKTYSFVTFTDTKIGKTAVLSENEMYKQEATFWNVTFTNCEFQNIKFVNCKFFGCKFINCKTKELGIIFEDCFFQKTSVGHNDIGVFETNIVSTEFVDCWITAEFRKTELDNAIWDKCTFILTDFKDCSVKESIFFHCGFYSTKFIDTDIAGIGILQMKNADLKFYLRYDDSEFHKSAYIDLMSYKNAPSQQGDRTNLKEANRKNAADLSQMYYTLLDSLKSKNSDIEFLGEYRYQYQLHKMRAKEKLYSKIWDLLSWGICGYGEKVGRFLAWFAGCILFFAVCYMFSGLQLADRKIQYVLVGGKPFDLIQTIKDFGMCIHFSVVTFSTVGYGNITPLGWASTIWCTAQILLGLVFVAIFTSIMINKLIRK